MIVGYQPDWLLGNVLGHAGDTNLPTIISWDGKGWFWKWLSRGSDSVHLCVPGNNWGFLR